MRRILPLILLLSCALAMDAAAQGTRPPRDTVRIGARPAGDSIRMAEFDAEDEDAPAADAEDSEDADTSAEADTDTVPVPKPGPYARSGGTGPFSVQTSGEVAPRPERGEVVWVNTPAPRVAAADSARAGSGQRVTSGQTTRRDTASPARPAGRDTARTGSGQRVTSAQTTRRDTASATRPNRAAPRDTIRPGATQRPGTNTQAGGRTGSATASGNRPRAHTVAAGETFYGIARRYGVTAAQLRALNPDVDMNELEVGDVLRLPAGARDSRAPAQPRTGSGAQPQQGRTQAQPARGSRAHTVQAGETLFGIARRYGVTVEAIRRANEMETDQVRTGQRLVIPPAS